METLLSLLEKYEIIIPLMQRDYAQGRTDGHSSTVRYEFVNALYNALIEIDNLHLDFLYGTTHDGKLTLLDGQQRTTTLFLLHCYIANRAEVKSEKEWKHLKRFSYETRTSSRLFCKQLIDWLMDNQVIDGSNESNASMRISDTIKNQCWFFHSWKQDPTIQSMLVMLDALQKKFTKSQNFSDLWKRLTADRLITFDFLEMTQYNLTDDLYMRMNARGKRLTDFENFKAWLHRRLDNKMDDFEQWHQLMDKDWADLFWKMCNEEDVDRYDAAFMRYFRTVALNEYATDCDETKIEKKDDEGEKARKIIKKLNNEEYFSLYEYEEQDLFKPETCKKAFHVLNRWEKAGLLKKNGGERLEALPFFSEKQKPEFYKLTEGALTFAQRVMFHALFLYLDYFNSIDFRLTQWMRIIRNLSVNTTFDSTRYVRAIQSVNKLFINCTEKCNSNGTFMNCFAERIDKIQGFDKNQTKEESKKAKLISCCDEWWHLIIKAEAHAVLKCQIGVLLDDDCNIRRTKKRWYVFESLFDTNGRSKFENFLLARATLAKSEDLRLGWQAELKLKDEPSHWKELIGYPKKEHQQKFKSGFRKLLDHLSDCCHSYYDSVLARYDSELKKICREETKNNADWIRDLALYGNKLLCKDLSNHSKVKTYKNHGTFIYHKEYALEKDIMIGEKGKKRNNVINELMDNGWKIEESRIVEAESDIDQSETTTFYKGHEEFRLENEIHSNYELRVCYKELKLYRKFDGTEPIEKETWLYDDTPVESIIEKIEEKLSETGP